MDQLKDQRGAMEEEYARGSSNSDGESFIVEESN